MKHEISDTYPIQTPEQLAHIGGTVMELMASMSEEPNYVRMSGPQRTPPVPMPTTSRSGNGYAQIADDTNTDHLFE